MANETTACEHNFVHLDTSRWTDYSGFNTKFTRIDRYFCTKCLKEEEIKKEAAVRDTPDWYR